MWSNAEPQTQTQTQTTSSQTMTTKDGREAWETDMEGSSLPESESRFLFFCSLFVVWRFQKRMMVFILFFLSGFSLGYIYRQKFAVGCDHLLTLTWF